jgi:integrase
MNFPKKEGKCGPIYQVAEGLLVAQNEWGTWQVLVRQGAERKKKSFGKTEDYRVRAIKAAELLADRLGLTLERQSEEGRTFGMVADEWFNLNAGRWRPGTQERYACIVRDHLRPLEKMPLEKVDKARVKRLLADLLQIRAPKTVEVTHAVISGIFTEANELGYIEVNPAHGLLKRILPSRKKRVRGEPDPLNRENLEEFLEAVWAKLPEPFPLILETMAMTGLRLGEAGDERG